MVVGQNTSWKRCFVVSETKANVDQYYLTFHPLMSSLRCLLSYFGGNEQNFSWLMGWKDSNKMQAHSLFVCLSKSKRRKQVILILSDLSDTGILKKLCRKPDGQKSSKTEHPQFGWRNMSDNTPFLSKTPTILQVKKPNYKTSQEIVKLWLQLFLVRNFKQENGFILHTSLADLKN